MSIRPARDTAKIEVGQRAYEVTFKRPGFEGLKRIAKHYAVAIADANPFNAGAPSPVVESEIGRGALMEAVLREYLETAPDHWWAGNKQPEAGKPGLVNCDQDIEEFLQVGEAALKFHGTFRDLDARLRASGRP
jgi:hypothetical protein